MRKRIYGDNLWFRGRSGILRRLNSFFGRLRALYFSLIGVTIGKYCIFQKKVDFLYGWRTKFGDGCIIDSYAQFKCPTRMGKHYKFNIDIGDYVFIGRGTIIDSNLLVKIGNNTFVAPYCLIIDSNHIFDDDCKPIREQGCSYKNIIIGEDVWIGAHSIITAGVTVGNNSIVAANSTVTKDVPRGVMVGGSPARIIKSRQGFDFEN